jgi:hypothetical protein
MTYRHAGRDDGGWDVIARSNKYWVAEVLALRPALAGHQVGRAA